MSVGVVLAGLLRVMGCMREMAMRDMSVMGGLVMIAGFVMLCGALVMFCGVLVMFGGLAVVRGGFFRHRRSDLRPNITSEVLHGNHRRMNNRMLASRRVYDIFQPGRINCARVSLP